MSISWKNYSNRRRLEPAGLFRRQKIQSYADLIAYCSGHGIIPPKEEEISHYFEAQSSISSPIAEKEPSAPLDAGTAVEEPDSPPRTEPPAKKSTKSPTKARPRKSTKKVVGSTRKN